MRSKYFVAATFATLAAAAFASAADAPRLNVLLITADDMKDGAEKIVRLAS